MNRSNSELIRHLRSVTVAYQRDIAQIVKELEHNQNVYSCVLPDLERIADKVCQFYRIDPANLMSRKRDAETAWARQVAIYLAVKTSKHRADRIAAFFHRKRNSVAHTMSTVENRMSTDKRVKAEMDQLLPTS